MATFGVRCYCTVRRGLQLARSSPTPILITNARRLRAPKRAPIPSQLGQSGGGVYDAPLLSPGAEMSSAPPGSPGPKPLFLCQPFVKAALVKGSFKTIVAPPKYVDVNEWVAINCECPASVRGVCWNRT